MISPKRPAPAMVARISDAAFPVELADAALPEPELLAEEPVWLAPLDVAEAEPNVAVLDAPLVAVAPAAVLVRKYELTQLAWHEAYASVSCWVPFPCVHSPAH